MWGVHPAHCQHPLLSLILDKVSTFKYPPGLFIVLLPSVLSQPLSLLGHAWLGLTLSDLGDLVRSIFTYSITRTLLFCHNMSSRPENQLWFVPLNSQICNIHNHTMAHSVTESPSCLKITGEIEAQNRGGIYSIHVAWGWEISGYSTCLVWEQLSWHVLQFLLQPLIILWALLQSFWGQGLCFILHSLCQLCTLPAHCVLLVVCIIPSLWKHFPEATAAATTI